VQVPSPGSTKEAQLANVSLSVHSTPEQASHVFERTRPRMAVYSHIIPPETTSEQLTQLTRPIYKGPLTVAHDLMEITLVGDQIIIGERGGGGRDAFEKSRVLTKKTSPLVSSRK
jgi:ribonuclease Z